MEHRVMKNTLEVLVFVVLESWFKLTRLGNFITFYEILNGDPSDN